MFEPGGAVAVREVPMPKPEAGGVLLRVCACGICGSDLHVLQGDWPMQPHQMGHEIAAEVVETAGESGIVTGDHVAVEPVISCGRYHYCADGNYVHCHDRRMIGLDVPGGNAEYVCAPVTRMLHRVPPTRPWDIAAMSEPLAVAVHVLRLAGLANGMRVAIVGVTRSACWP